MAIGVIRALLEHGVRVPDDMSVTGFDDMPGMSNLYPPLTTVRQDFDDLGTMAMKEALFLMGGGGRAGLPELTAWRGTGVGGPDCAAVRACGAAQVRVVRMRRSPCRSACAMGVYLEGVFGVCGFRVPAEHPH
jgi:ABC-type sugar transport system substrate-binding protein